MKKFEIPTMSIQKLAPEGIIATSECWVEAKACIKCYVIAGECPSGFTCTELVCPNLQAIEDMD